MRLTAHELFWEQSRRTPERPAVEHRGQRLTYAELAAAADRLAARLDRLGVRGGVVGICVDRSFHLPIAILATLRAGAAYLPLDPSYPAERLAFMMTDSAVRACLLVARTRDRLTIPAGTPVIELSAPSDGDPRSDQDRRPVASDDLAYVMYTSGSTGRPKGVAMPHGPLVNLIAWQRAASSCGQGARTLQFSAASFDASFQEMFSTWSAGGLLVLVDEDVRRDAQRLARFIAEERINRLFMPFVALQALANAACSLNLYPQALREVITAGEQLYVTPALRRFFGALPGTTLDNQYGPSETHIITAVRLGSDPAMWPTLPPIGWPISGASVEIVNDDGTRVADGAVGEIWIGGSVLARGYLDRPGLTAERFVPSDCGAPGDRLYRTGDLGRILPDGQIEFLGRIDHQVKIRGYRVELGEVEAVVKAAPGISDAVVVVSELPAGRRLVAYVIGDDPDLVARAEAYAASKLPEYMVPMAFVPVHGFPATPSGKVDRLALSRRASGRKGSGGTVAPDTVEAELLRLMAETLAVSELGVDDNFFGFGGDSLTGALLITRINEAFGVGLDVEALFTGPTATQLGAVIRRERVGG